MIQTILIANRGEIACRIMRTCREMGIRTVAVYSTADNKARHLLEADEAVWIGDAPPTDSYLHIERIISAAHQSGAEAIHPGFGFLAENATFAQAVTDAGLIFIGPSAEAIAAMGNKRAAKELVVQAGVPVVPGYHGRDQTDDTLLAEAEKIGMPLMVKAAAGGGGKGMRLVHEAADLPDALASARREAWQAFGADELTLERAVIQPRHVEFQVLGDKHGRVIHLGERDCSVQRRHQKVVEEAPAPHFSPELRQKMGNAAVAAAQSVGYFSAGTVEFLLDAEGNFYFLEMNTRIQVEHPVTERITGLDLVAWQIRIAEGEQLTLAQEDVSFDGHAVEVRLYAENPAQDYLPVTGEIALWRAPEGVRVDSGLKAQDEVTIFYDPLLAKLIAHGRDRTTAIRQLAYALEQTRLLGLTTNQYFLRDVLLHEAFVAGEVHTGFLDTHFANWAQPEGEVEGALTAVSIAQYEQASRAAGQNGYWRNSPNRPQLYRYADQPDVQLTPERDGYTVQIGDGEPSHVSHFSWYPDNFEAVLVTDGRRQRLTIIQQGDKWWAQNHRGIVQLLPQTLLPEPAPPADAGGSLRAPMPGVVLEVLVEAGQAITQGQALLKLEAMKMEHTIRSGADGVVAEIYFAAGEQVTAEAQLLRIETV